MRLERSGEGGAALEAGGLWTGFANCGIISHMDQGEPIPGTKASGAIERWMRGLAVLALVGIAALATALVAGLAMWATEALGFPVLAAYVAVGIAAAVLPWQLGGRKVLRALGGLAKH